MKPPWTAGFHKDFLEKGEPLWLNEKDSLGIGGGSQKSKRGGVGGEVIGCKVPGGISNKRGGERKKKKKRQTARRGRASPRQSWPGGKKATVNRRKRLVGGSQKNPYGLRRAVSSKKRAED